MPEPVVVYAVDGGIARITLNRPEKRNALDAATIAGLKEAFGASAMDSSVRVVVLTGAGRDFCSGADLSSLQRTFDRDVLENMSDAQELADLFLEMRHHRRPIIAAVRGRALAGGCGLATAADVILASETAQFGYPEVNIGFVPAMVMAILRRSVSEKRAFDLITGGDIISAQVAYDIGMITRVLSDETFEMETQAYAAKLAGKSAAAISLSKHLLYHMDAMSFEAAITAGVQVNGIARMTEDCRKSVAAFLKGRKAPPTGSTQEPDA